MVFGVMLVAGAVGLAGYGMAKRRERHKVANGYVSYHHDDNYANIHYGSKNRSHAGQYEQQPSTYTNSNHYANVSRY